MFRRMDQANASRLLKGVEMAALLGFSTMAFGQTQPQALAPASNVMPDAQIEANVLKALAGAPDLANQAVTTTTVYGVVTLSGSVQTEALRTEAETITSRTSGVKKVVDEMTLGTDATNAQSAQDSGSAVADAQAAQQGSPDTDNTAPTPNQASGPNYGPGAPEYRQPYGGRQQAPPPGYAQPGYPQQQQGYGPPRQPYNPPQAYNGAPQQPIYGGQQEGIPVTIPSGAMVRIRINQTLDSSHTQPGTVFNGIVVNDVVADGAVAIPRGASIQGTVIDAKKSGALAGRGELSLQLTQVTLGGKSYPVVSDVWAHHAGDKTAETVDKTVVGGGIGALIGAAAGGGAGAAIGAGVGGLLGLGSSAASGNGQMYIPAEGLLTFHLAQPATVATVSQQEMDRLSQGAGPAGQQPQLHRRYPNAYYGPAYYRGSPYPYSVYPY